MASTSTLISWIERAEIVLMNPDSSADDKRYASIAVERNLTELCERADHGDAEANAFVNTPGEIGAPDDDDTDDDGEYGFLFDRF